MTRHPLPSVKRLNEVLDYNRKTGIFIWKVRLGHPGWNVLCAGKTAGTTNSSGYIEISVDNINYQAARLAWKIDTGADPKNEIDHRNLVHTDNRIENLREATGSQNCANKESAALLGKCVRETKPGRFQVRIKKNGKRFCLGTFDSASDAIYAYALAARSMFGRFARV